VNTIHFVNIFFLSLDPKECAQWHLDKHVVKMPLESTQMLFSAYYAELGFSSPKDRKTNLKKVWDRFATLPRKDEKGNPDPYGMTHFNHPSTKWSRACIENWEWLHSLASQLCYEYHRRYKPGQLKVEPLLLWMLYNPPNLPSNGGKITPPPLCMPDDSKVVDNPVESYHNYYNNHKREIAKWKTPATKPSWYKN
jgi:hypothetical protein